MNVKINLNQLKIISKVENDRMGLFVSQNLKRLLDPFTPRNTGLLQDTAEIKPWEIIYRGGKTSNGKYYAADVYYGYNLNFQKKNPYSTFEWDVAAAQAGQLDKLYQTINNALRSGRI